MTGASSSAVEPVVDLAPPRLLGESAVRVVEHAPEVDLLVPHREAMSLELREIEDVSDETLEPVRLRSDDVERRLDLIRLGDDAFAQRLHVATNRCERRPQLVRDRHEERALELLGLGELVDHAPEAVAELRDLVAAPRLGDLDLVAPRRDLLRRAREREHRLGQPARQPPEEKSAERDPDRERERQPPEQRQPLLAKLGDRLRDHEPAERLGSLRRAVRAGRLR